MWLGGRGVSFRAAAENIFFGQLIDERHPVLLWHYCNFGAMASADILTYLLT